MVYTYLVVVFHNTFKFIHFLYRAEWLWNVNQGAVKSTENKFVTKQFLDFLKPTYVQSFFTTCLISTLLGVFLKIRVELGSHIGFLTFSKNRKTHTSWSKSKCDPSRYMFLGSKNSLLTSDLRFDQFYPKWGLKRAFLRSKRAFLRSKMDKNTFASK